jgi:undecaprenyl-diphosphatase
VDLTTALGAAFLGVIEGLTEFLPVSSTGHLILLVDLIGFRGPPGKVFEIAIQLGAILAVCVLYRERLIRAATGAVRDLARGGGPDLRFAIVILLAFLPAMILGVLAHGFIKDRLFNPWVVATMLILGGIAIIAIERALPTARHDSIERLPYGTALAIGFVQCLAMIPGTSRSGATIMGALLMRVERRTAAEFSFFLAIPTMFAATIYDLWKNRDALSFDGAAIIAIGFLAAFVTALIVVRAFVTLVGRHGFSPFAWYRIALGVVILLILALR